MYKTGIAYLPGTFPTGVVLEAIKEGMPRELGYSWTRQKVNDLYWLYKTAVQKHGKPTYKTGQTEAKQWIMDNSEFTEVDIRVFLYVLLELSKSGDIDIKFWDIPLQKEKGILPNIDKVTKNMDNFAGAIRWGSMFVLAAGTLYFVWPYIKKFRSKK